jgi:hypothetical protein
MWTIIGCRSMRTNRTVEVSVDGDVLRLSHVTAEQQDR